MNKNAKMWATELTNFKQGPIEELGSPETGFCCLGVACAIYERETGNQLPKNEDGRYLNEYDEFLSKEFRVVKEWLDLDSDEATYINKSSGVSRSLTVDNDSGKSFAEIQRIILSQPEGLFKEHV